ncbi:MAG: ribose-5-phosphate isomerase rki1 [Watsoniomyces obsoletus]|nr:MAG: ribose-5-phosphate isomerase rki1 [Watsoniomyces obsoletus]
MPKCANPTRHEQGGSSAQKPRTVKRPPSSIGKRSDQGGSTVEPTRDSRKRRGTPTSMQIERQLNLTEAQAQLYRKIDTEKIDKAKGKEREQRNTKQSPSARATETIDLTEEPAHDESANVMDLEFQLALEKSAWTQVEDGDLKLGLEQSLLESEQPVPRQRDNDPGSLEGDLMGLYDD